MKISERLFLSQLNWRTRPAVIVNHLKKKQLQPGAKKDTRDQSRIRAAAAQLELKLVKDVREYVDEMTKFTQKAANEGADLLVFPENNAYQLFGLIPGIEKIAHGPTPSEQSLPTKVADLFLAVGPVFVNIAITTFSYLAKTFQMYIVAGSFPYPVGTNVYNRALIFAPDGTLLGSQDKVHLMPLEQSWGLSAGESFQVFDTHVGNLAAPVCMDASYYETFRVVRTLGADIVAISIANPEEYNPWLALRGTWPRVQESLVYGIKSAMVGKIFGFTLTGKAGIFAPLPLSPKQDGVLAEVPYADREDFVVADLDLPALHALRATHPYLLDQNPRLMEKYFPSIYENIPQ